MIQKNRFPNIKENFFDSTNHSSIQRNFFFDGYQRNYFLGVEGLI